MRLEKRLFGTGRLVGLKVKVSRRKGSMSSSIDRGARGSCTVNSNLCQCSHKAHSQPTQPNASLFCPSSIAFCVFFSLCVECNCSEFFIFLTVFPVSHVAIVFPAQTHRGCPAAGRTAGCRAPAARPAGCFRRPGSAPSAGFLQRQPAAFSLKKFATE